MSSPVYVPGYGSSSAKLMVVGEAPGSHEVEHLLPFMGPAGNLLNEALEYAGTSRGACYLTNVVKVRPPKNRIDDLHLIGCTIEQFLPQLWEEVKQIDPNCILAVGNTALTALTGFKGIEKYRGSILQAKTGHKVVSCLHPAAVLPHEGAQPKPWKEFSWIKADVKRAYEESMSKILDLPHRHLKVAESSIDVYRFLNKYVGLGKTAAAIDVETIKTFTQCVGIAFNDWDALSIPTFEDSSDMASQELDIIWKLLAEFFYDTKIDLWAQNAKFDEKRCRQIGLTWHDLAFDLGMGWHVLYPEFPKKLQFITSVLTREPYYKDEGTEFNMGRGKKENFKQWCLYNAKDAVTEYECCAKVIEMLKADNLWDFYIEKVHPLHRIYSDMEDVGILIDDVVHKQLDEKYTKAAKERQARLISDIADGHPDIAETYKNFNVMSNGPKNQVAKLLYGFLGLPVRKDTGDETLKALANNHAKQQRVKGILLGILEVRKLRKTIGTYINAKPSVPDITRFGRCVKVFEDKPRMHTVCNINGTETGRTSTGILKAPVSIEHEGIAMQTMTKHEDLNLSAGGGDLRAMMIADPGFSLIEPDQSQAEDRAVCVLARDWKALEDYARTEFKFNKHGLKDDRHTTTTIYVCQLGFEAITDWYRQIGKKTRHSGNYAVGKHQHMLTLATGGIFVSEWQAGKQLERFHAENPQISGVFWEDIQQALHDNNNVLITPFGRRRIFYSQWGPDLFKEAYAHIPQSTISDQTKFAMVRIARRLGRSYMRDFFFLEESHDSFLGLCRDSLIPEAAVIIKQEFERAIDFKKCSLSRDYQLVIPCEIKVGKRWIEDLKNWPDGMRKYKV
jgi:DNA polymerase